MSTDIIVTAKFEVTLKKQLTANQLANLENGMGIEYFVDESEVYNLLRTEGECEMDWDYAKPQKPKAKKTKATTRKKKGK